MSLLTFIKDYTEVINNVYDLNSGNLSYMQAFFTTIHFLAENFKNLIIYLITFQWLRDFIYLPIIIPQMATIHLKEIFIRDLPSLNYFSFIEQPLNIHNKFLLGILNSFFISLPFSVSHLISLRRLIVQGLPAGIFAAFGTIFGQILFLIFVLFGFRFGIINWFSFEPYSYLIGFF